jgi:hypothetical protein
MIERPNHGILDIPWLEKRRNALCSSPLHAISPEEVIRNIRQSHGILGLTADPRFIGYPLFHESPLWVDCGHPARYRFGVAVSAKNLLISAKLVIWPRCQKWQTVEFGGPSPQVNLLIEIYHKKYPGQRRIIANIGKNSSLAQPLAERRPERQGSVGPPVDNPALRSGSWHRGVRSGRKIRPTYSQATPPLPPRAV